MTVPQHQFLWSTMDVVSGHHRRYRRSALLDKLRRAGFVAVYATSFVSVLLPLVLESCRTMRHRAPDGMEELRIGAWKNRVLSRVMDVERALIRSGAPMPAGGSLLVVARKPVRP